MIRLLFNIVSTVRNSALCTSVFMPGLNSGPLTVDDLTFSASNG
jgi:hypothetical protein